MMKSTKLKNNILLVASSGGHTNQIYYLKELWKKYDRTWVTFKTDQGKSLVKEGENVIWGFSPTNRNLLNLIKNFGLAISLLRTRKYDIIISTGAGLGVPFVWVGRLFGIYTIFVDSFTRTKDLSLSAKLVYFVSDDLLTQWSNVKSKYKKLKYKGKVL